MQKPNSVKVNLKLPFIGGIEGNWEFDEIEKKAAWEMYVELVTRISVVKLEYDEGLLREALSSLHTLFSTTRNILREYGPTVAIPKGKDNLSFGYISIVILNTLIRPVLSKWHPLLLDYESNRGNISPLEHERNWDKHDELREVLEEVRIKLIEYANLLSEVSNVPSLIIEEGIESE